MVYFRLPFISLGLYSIAEVCCHFLGSCLCYAYFVGLLTVSLPLRNGGLGRDENRICRALPEGSEPLAHTEPWPLPSPPSDLSLAFLGEHSQDVLSLSIQTPCLSPPALIWLLPLPRASFSSQHPEPSDSQAFLADGASEPEGCYSSLRTSHFHPWLVLCVWNCLWPSWLVINLSASFLKFFFRILFIYFYLFNFFCERGRETSMCGCFLHNPHWGPGQQPGHVP